MHLAVTGDWPDEAAPLQAFGEEAQSVTVSPQHFYLVTQASAEDKPCADWVLLRTSET